MVRILTHTDRRQRGIHPLPQLRIGYAEILRSESNVLLDNGRDQLIVRVLEHHANLSAQLQQVFLGQVVRHNVPPADQYLPFRIRVIVDDQVDELGKRGFTRSVMPENHGVLAFPDRQIDV